MNECMEREIREMLPDVLHGTVVPGGRARIEEHLATCGQCRQELEVLRAVHGAAVFIPSIDVQRIVRQIPPHGIITPVVERPAPSRRMVGWLTAAAVAFLVAGGGSVLMRNGNTGEAPAVAVVPEARGLALASGVDELSDGGLVQLMDEMTDFDALPTAEPEPELEVEINGTLEQDSL